MKFKRENNGKKLMKDMFFQKDKKIYFQQDHKGKKNT